MVETRKQHLMMQRQVESVVVWIVTWQWSALLPLIRMARSENGGALLFAVIEVVTLVRSASFVSRSLHDSVVVAHDRTIAGRGGRWN
jgi:hypothetical protein